MKKVLRICARLLVLAVVIVAGLLWWNLRPPGVPEPAEFRPAQPSLEFKPLRLRVVTWNVWGLRWLTPRREERLLAVAREVAALRPDIVGFQEAYVKVDRDALATALQKVGLDHSEYFPSGLVGSGLLVVSRYPIESKGFIRFVSNGRPEALQHGDWWAGKGMSLASLKLPDGTRLYLGDTHFHARYKSTRYHATQLAQAAQLVPWAARVQDSGSPALWLGDWNGPPDSDVLQPLLAAGDWHLLTHKRPHLDHIFGSGKSWKWNVVAEGKCKGHLPGDPKVPWSDHAAVWVDIELRRDGL